jgi:hypothetical protein
MMWRGGQNILTVLSCYRLLWIVMTAPMSLALAGQEFRPSCLPGLRLTKKFLDGLIKDLNENLLAGLDPNPNLWRSRTKPQMYPAVQSGSIKRIVFVSGSNAKSLSQAASMLGIDSYMIATGGWKLSCENVDKLIPDLHALMSGLPPALQLSSFAWTIPAFWRPQRREGWRPSPSVWRGTTATM